VALALAGAAGATASPLLVPLRCAAISARPRLAPRAGLFRGSIRNKLDCQTRSRGDFDRQRLFGLVSNPTMPACRGRLLHYTLGFNRKEVRSCAKISNKSNFAAPVPCPECVEVGAPALEMLPDSDPKSGAKPGELIIEARELIIFRWRGG
jgi:hypothetical protein